MFLGFAEGRFGFRSLMERMDVAWLRCVQLLLDEGQDVFIHLLLRGRDQAMAFAGIDLEDRVWQELGSYGARVRHRNQLVGIAVNDEDRHINFLEVFGRIGLGKDLHAEVGGMKARGQALAQERFTHTLRDLRSRQIIPIKGEGDVLEELRPIREESLADSVESLHGQPTWIASRFQHQRRGRCNQDRLGNPGRSVATQITNNFASSNGMADVDDILQIERLH